LPRVIAAIMRHGDYHQPEDVPSAHLPYPLTAKGREQAAAAADEILTFADRAGLEIHGIVGTSRLLRAYETGAILAARLAEHAGRDFAVTEYDDLAERSVGAGANLTLAQIAKIVEDDPRHEALPEGWKAMANFRLPLQGAESLREAGRRVASRIEQTMHNLSRECTRDTVKVLVGHGAAFRYAAVHLGVLHEDEAPKLSMFHCRPVFIEQTGDGWRHVGGEWKVRDRAAMD